MSCNDPVKLPQEVTATNEEATRNQELRRGFTSFLNLMIILSLLACAVICLLIAFPLPEGMINLKLAKLFLLELAGFFPSSSIFAYVMSALKLNRKENSGLIIRVLIYIGLLWTLTNVSVIFLTRIAVMG